MLIILVTTDLQCTIHQDKSDDLPAIEVFSDDHVSILVLLAWSCDISLLCRLFTVMQEELSMKVCMLRIIFVDIAPP